jgi:hypothetical protein
MNKNKMIFIFLAIVLYFIYRIQTVPEYEHIKSSIQELWYTPDLVSVWTESEEIINQEE